MFGVVFSRLKKIRISSPVGRLPYRGVELLRFQRVDPLGTPCFFFFVRRGGCGVEMDELIPPPEVKHKYPKIAMFGWKEGDTLSEASFVGYLCKAFRWFWGVYVFTKFTVPTIFSRNERVWAGPLCLFEIILNFMLNLILVPHETQIGGHVLDGLESTHN